MKFRLPNLILLVVITSMFFTACQMDTPTGPTPIPSLSATASLSPSPIASSIFSPTPPPELRPMITATPPPLPTVVAQVIEATATLGPKCYVVKEGETLADLIYRAGYNDFTVLNDVIALNGLDGSTIGVGQTVCIPQKTATPTPENYSGTQTEQARFSANSGPIATTTYIVKEGDDVTLIQLEFGISLKRLCELNEPHGQLNCAGCKLDAAIPECRPLIVIGQTLFVPGPTPTPTITPTLTGSETVTPTPAYAAPLPLSPAINKMIPGTAQLLWMPTGVLSPDEYYLVVWSDVTSQITQQVRVKEPTYRLPAEFQPVDGVPHTINWQVAVARDGGESDILVSPLSHIYTFVWASR